MLKKYNNFIKNVLCNKDYLNNEIVLNLLNKCHSNGKYLYTSNLTIDDEEYYLLVAFFKNKILINSKVTRVYIDNGYEGYIKETYTDEVIDKFIKKDNDIYYYSNKIKKAYLEYEYSSIKTTTSEESKERIFKNTDSFNDISLSNKKIKTKRLFYS